jgi:speckle-type POZ protein
MKEPQMLKTHMSFEFDVPPSDLLDNLRGLLETGEESDVSFKVKDEVFAAHKIVMAMRSPVFKAELYGPMRDSCVQSITIKDMEPAVFKALLHFIYTDKLPPMDNLGDDGNEDYDEEMVKHLLVAADRYAMERMKLMCEKKLCQFLKAETVASTLALADQYHCSKLKDACIMFINSLDTMDDVMTSIGYEHLKNACPTIFIDIWEKAAKRHKK